MEKEGEGKEEEIPGGTRTLPPGALTSTRGGGVECDAPMICDPMLLICYNGKTQPSFRLSSRFLIPVSLDVKNCEYPKLIQRKERFFYRPYEVLMAKSPATPCMLMLMLGRCSVESGEEIEDEE
jgi:hypothetical protein